MIAMDECRLHGELKKRHPFTCPVSAAILNLLITSDRVQIRLDRLFREHGLTGSQYNILRILRGEGTPLPVLEIASRTVAVVPGITGLIDRLEAAGLVARRRCSHDRRVVHVAITPEGLERIAAIDAPLESAQAAIMGSLTPDEQQTLSRLLEKIRGGLSPEGS
jgi:MarR family 2-MHQ and catechol resistance regulon transcriptional repressor